MTNPKLVFIHCLQRHWAVEMAVKINTATPSTLAIGKIHSNPTSLKSTLHPFFLTCLLALCVDSHSSCSLFPPTTSSISDAPIHLYSLILPPYSQSPNSRNHSLL